MKEGTYPVIRTMMGLPGNFPCNAAGGLPGNFPCNAAGGLPGNLSCNAAASVIRTVIPGPLVVPITKTQWSVISIFFTNFLGVVIFSP